MKLYPFALASAAVIGTAAVLVASGTAASETGTTQSQQLLINQRISQAAVKRSNSALNYLAPVRTAQTDANNTGANGVTPLSRVTGSGLGWTTAQIANQAITPAKLSNPSYFAVVTGAGAVSRASTGVTVALAAPSTYTVTFPNAVSACGYSASIGEATAGAAIVSGEVNVQPGTLNGQVVVTTLSSTGSPTAAPFHLTVQC